MMKAALLWLALMPAQANAVRIETAEALSQIVKRVDPAVPAEAHAAKVGGTVIADVIVDTKGVVTTVVVIGGPDMLHAAANAALRQWRFTPFVRGGKPIPVRVILEVDFPDPIREQERRVYEEHRAAERECERLTNAEPVRAPAVCAEAVRLSGSLPADRILERAHTVGLYAASLAGAGRMADAISQMERVITLRDEAGSGRPNADTADAYHVIGLLNAQLGNTAQANAAYATAIQLYEGAIESWPAARERYEPRLRRALLAQADVKRRTGDAAGAAALEERAGPLASETVPRATGVNIRTIDGMQIAERGKIPLSEADLAGIRAALEQKGMKAWLLAHRGPDEHATHGRDWFVEAYLDPTLTTPALRRGEVEFVIRNDGTWTVQPMAAFYIQFGTEPPMKVQAAPNKPAPPLDEIAELVKFVRQQAEVNPWPVDSLVFYGDEASVTLHDQKSDSSQLFRLRHDGTTWRVTDIR
ncbi:MAG TPA: TonB family protein [Vicinamibacterales bacterium]